MPEAEKEGAYLITAALPYVNLFPHVGNISSSHLPADIYARYCRLKGRKTLFIGGTDEHGTPSEVTAQKLGISPKELCDKLYEIHKKIYDWFECSYDNFSRTSREIHHKTTQEFFKKLYDNGYISEGVMKVLYCPKCDRFLPDRYVEGKCPRCGYETARGDQCEKCAALLDPTELINPYCVICHGKPEVKESRHLFLDLDKLSPQVKEWIENNKQLKEYAKSMALGLIKEGLKKRCITRDLKWGVKVPLEGYENKLFYVWFDAPIGYASSTREIGEEQWNLWKDKSTKLVHFIGKDNIPFHIVFFPAMLIGTKEYILPYQVNGYHFMNYEGGKISKSLMKGVFCEKLPETGTDPDIWRFYITLKIPESKDTDFSWEDFESRISTELIGNLSNFINRTLAFVKTKYNNEVPAPSELDEEDKKIIEEIKKGVEKTDKLLDEIEIPSALWSILDISKLANQYFQSKEPWKDIEKAKTTINICVNICNTLSILLAPFLPRASERINKMLNAPAVKWENADKQIIKAGHKIGEPEILFEKLTPEKIKELKEKVTKPQPLEDLFKK